MSKTASRAYPNQRLQIVFGIDNAFTTTDFKRRMRFKGIASRHLKQFDTEWRSAGEDARFFVKQRLDQAKEGVKVAPLIQVLALRLSLQAIHDVDVTTIDDDDLSFVAREINRLWVSSKKNSTLEHWSQQFKLHGALDALCPDSECSIPEKNALNLILPSYETLWRIVLRCFMEVAFCEFTDRKVLWRMRLSKFLAEPSFTNLEDRGEWGGSIYDVVREALRLYPPTRRVYREFQYEGRAERELVAADIECLQREHPKNRQLSEKDDPVFHPQLWVRHEAEMNEGFMPFGRDKFLCPAQAKFGIWAIAILVASLTVEVGTAWQLRPNPVTRNAPLETDREAYLNLVLRRM
ncbi:hypothetical protein EV356DRAFT_504649 [Viridothelium virens]|uniref:Cytochrome P450 n=1 Tax=Viridothelium virens TaxID=1048519 RepID=A0A6A6H4Y7_VIRVR|nr:hypothetical protein EV356DRAFT_504649 [Viridothelium virens]